MPKQSHSPVSVAIQSVTKDIKKPKKKRNRQKKRQPEEPEPEVTEAPWYLEPIHIEEPSPEHLSTNNPSEVSVSEKPLVHKCCGEKEIFSHKHKSCVQNSHNIPFKIPVFTQDSFGMFLETNFTINQVRIYSIKFNIHQVRVY